MALLDPAGQQRAVFDLAWGGALASLKWNGVEYAYGNAIGAMVQPALHHGNPDWNPTLAGANGGPGSPATGVRCLDSNTLQIQTTMLDFNSVDGPPSAYQAVLNGVLVAGKWSTPYVMVTTASFVPSGYASPAPAYYLKLEQQVVNTHPSRNWIHAVDLAGYVPYAFGVRAQFPAECTPTSACSVSATNVLVGGFYTSANLQTGVAFYVSPRDAWLGYANWTFVALQDSPGPWATLSKDAHLFGYHWTLQPGTSRKWDWFVLVGPWEYSLQWAANECDECT